MVHKNELQQEAGIKYELTEAVVRKVLQSSDYVYNFVLSGTNSYKQRLPEGIISLTTGMRHVEVCFDIPLVFSE